jgi:hypothetical protein
VIVRPARLEDVRAIGMIHVRAYQAAYVGIVPAEFLGSLSIEPRKDVWGRIVKSGESNTEVAEEAELDRREDDLGEVATDVARSAGACLPPRHEFL